MLFYYINSVFAIGMSMSPTIFLNFIIFPSIDDVILGLKSSKSSFLLLPSIPLSFLGTCMVYLLLKGTLQTDSSPFFCIVGKFLRLAVLEIVPYLPSRFGLGLLPCLQPINPILVLMANIYRLSLNYDTFSFFFLKALINQRGYSYFQISLSFLFTMIFPFSQISCQSWGILLMYKTQTLSDGLGALTSLFLVLSPLFIDQSMSNDYELSDFYFTFFDLRLGLFMS